jgi:hypothetical protein
MIIESTNRTFDISNEGSKIVANMEYIDSLHKFVHETMLPGPALFEIIVEPYRLRPTSLTLLGMVLGSV